MPLHCAAVTNASPHLAHHFFCLPACLPACSIVGQRQDSNKAQNKLTDVVAEAGRGEYTVRVRSQAGGCLPCL